MKPTNDLFEQQVRDLYEGFEVPAPASTKDAVFNDLDSANAPASGSFASKSLLIVASLLTVGAIYMLSGDTPSGAPAPVVIEDVVDETTKSEPAIEVPAVIEEVAIETLQVIEEVDELPVEIVEDIPEVVENVVEETVIETPEVVETPVVEEIKEVAPPVEVIADTPPVEEKKEEVEWVLPAKIKVEK